MKKFDTLYARDSKGRINEWSIKVEDYPNQGYSRTFINEGLIDGQKTETFRNTLNGKNKGKMNATTPYEQACSEAESRWEKKKKQGYKSLDDLKVSQAELAVMTLQDILNHSLPKDRTDAENRSKPMKAQPYFKDNGNVRINFPCFAQPKLNGFRVMARWETVSIGDGIFATEVEKVVFRSKEGLKYDILVHIEREFNREHFLMLYKDILTEVVYDGEMYIHGEILSEISSAVRKRNSKTNLLKFCIFDIAVENIKQNERITLINKLCINTNYNNITFVPSTIIENNEQAQIFTDECIKQGYEGAIFRDMKAEYQFGKRPQTMTKLKRSSDKEFKIIDVVGGDNSPELGVFICIQEEGKQFKVTPEGSRETKKEYLSNKQAYIGKNLTVRFFERTKDNLPFHAVGVTIRDYE